MAGRSWIYRRPPGLERLTKHLTPALYVHVHAWTQIENTSPSSWTRTFETLPRTIAWLTSTRHHLTIATFTEDFGVTIAEMVAPSWTQIEDTSGASWTQVSNP